MPPYTATLDPASDIVGRTRDHFGVGEVVEIAAFDRGVAVGAGFSWRIHTGGGSITATAGGVATYTAGPITAEVKLHLVRAQPFSVVMTKRLWVKAPTTVRMVRANNTIRHTNGMAGAGFLAHMRLQPTGVSFSNIEVREGKFRGVASGSFAHENGREHQTGPWLAVDAPNEVLGTDHIDSGDVDAPFVSGRFDWNIPWEYRVGGGGTVRHIDYIVHWQTINAAGFVTIEKGGVQVSKAVTDGDSPLVPPPPPVVAVVAAPVGAPVAAAAVGGG